MTQLSWRVEGRFWPNFRWQKEETAGFLPIMVWTWRAAYNARNNTTRFVLQVQETLPKEKIHIAETVAGYDPVVFFANNILLMQN